MPTSFNQTTFLTARQQLAARLADPSMSFWSDNELKFYIQQALRQYNSLVWWWKEDFTFNNSSSTNVWSSLATLTGSPRIRSVTDSYCYSEMEYMLLEPNCAGGPWTGTNQFSISDISQALQRRRDEMIQVSNCNQALLTGIAITPNTRRTYVPSNVIDVARVRYIPSVVSPATQPPPPVTLYRDDTVAQEFYESPLYQQPSGTPNTYSLSSEPPLAFDVDIPPDQPGTYEAIVLQQGASFNPPTSTLLGIPDDFSYVAEWGALADLLGRESEAKDQERAEYCMKRYQDGLNLMQKAPWIMLGQVNRQAVSIDSIVSSDNYSPEWDSDPSGFGPFIVAGGIDMIASPTGQSTGMTVLGNMPIPVADGDYLQIPPSDLDIIMDLSQARASFKLGGAEWKSALELEKRAIMACSAENSRLRSLGLYSDVLDQRGQAQERSMNRYNSKNGPEDARENR